MEYGDGYEPGFTIILLERAVWLLRRGLLVLTVLLVPILVLVLFGRGDIALSGTVTDPVTVTFEDGRFLGIGDDGNVRVFGNFPDVGNERGTVRSGTVVHVAVQVARSDTDSRLVITGGACLLLATIWIGLGALRDIVTSVRRGEPFDDRNPARMRQLSAALVASSLILALGQGVVNWTLDAEVGLRVGYGWVVWTPALAGVGLLGLGELFAEAARLRAFEESTI